jgi:hypothetical protein
MLMLVLPSEDGAYIRFYGSMEEMMSAHDWDDNPRSMPTIWLTPEQARQDPAYWDEKAAFLAKVEPMRLAPKETVITHELVRQ